jgi:hypothetical protein
VWRRRGLIGAGLTAAILTGIGILLIGTGAYADWLAALRGAAEVGRQGNFSVWAHGVTPSALLLATAIAVAFTATLRDVRLGFVAALPSGILLAPYSLIYALSVLVLAVRPTLIAAPRALGVIALTTNVGVITLPLAWAGTWLLVAMAKAARTWRTLPRVIADKTPSR